MAITGSRLCVGVRTIENQLDRVFYTLYRFVPCIALFAVSQKIIIKKLLAQFYAHTHPRIIGFLFSLALPAIR